MVVACAFILITFTLITWSLIQSNYLSLLFEQVNGSYWYQPEGPGTNVFKTGRGRHPVVQVCTSLIRPVYYLPFGYLKSDLVELR
jgi:hypothetical protein